MKYIVSLEDIKFRGFHGLYTFEKEQGNDFYVSVKVTKILPDHYIFDHIHKTVDYEKIYKICEAIMQHPEDLLEQIASKMIQQIKSELPGTEEVYISVSKSNPPVGGECKMSRVEMVM